MKRVWIITFVALAAIGSLEAAAWKSSLEAARKEAKEKNQFIFVDLFADWCGWCHRLEKEVFPAEKFQKATENMVLLRLDTEDGAEGSRFARELSVSSLPTSLVLTHDLTVVALVRGFAPASEFVAKMEMLSVEYREFAAEAKREKSFATDYKRRQALIQQYIARRGFETAEMKLKALIADKKAPADIRDAAFYDLAYTQFQQKRFDSAIATVKKLLAIQSKGASAERSRMLIGEAYLQQKKFEAARDEYRNFKADFPASPYVATIDQLLPQIESAIASKPKSR